MRWDGHIVKKSRGDVVNSQRLGLPAPREPLVPRLGATPPEGGGQPCTERKVPGSQGLEETSASAGSDLCKVTRGTYGL